MSQELTLNLLGELDRMNDRRKIHQEGIPDGLDDRAMVLGHCLLDDVIMDVQEPQHAGFVAAHLAAEANDVGEYDSVRRRVSAGLVLALSSAMAAIIGHVACGCQTMLAGCHWRQRRNEE